VAFFVYAYAQLFTHTDDVAMVWISLAVTAALYGLTILLFLVVRTLDPVALEREEPITRALLGRGR
jgi:hypothetical protein